MVATAFNSSTRQGGYPGSLDSLLALDAEALGALYRDATVPAIGDIRGDLRGRMLAIAAAEPPLFGGKVSTVRLRRLVSRFAASGVFPWLGKSFTPLDGQHGEGRNRVLRDRWKLFRFTTSVGKSRFGGFDAVLLDYDHKENPFFIRAVKDEIRQLRPGLYLGQAWAQVGDKTHLVLYFGLEG